jgi:hypothetical protein
VGQKVNPHGFRVGVISDWDAKVVCRQRLSKISCWKILRFVSLLKKNYSYPELPA